LLLSLKPDVIPVSDGSGDVVEVGEGVTQVKPGDRVAGAVFPEWIDDPFNWARSAQLGGSLDGMLTEYALLPENAVIRIPEHLTYEEGSTLPCAGVTALVASR
jgi:NADPH:quinone reductase-like Zn-dependent oxidoreductase